MACEEDELFSAYSADGAVALQDIEESLLALEGDPRDADEINRLYRALHTLKGNSALLGLNRIESLAHAAEDMVGLVRDRGVALDQELVELMLTLNDRLGAIVERAGSEQRDAEEQDVADLIERVRAWTSARGGVVEAAQGALRGEILVWSLPPVVASSATPALEKLGNDVLALEIFLDLSRTTLTTLHALLQQARDDCDVGAPFASACDELGAGAERLSAHDVASLLARLSERARLGLRRRENVEQQLSELHVLLLPIEQRYRSVAEFPQDFGIATLCARTAPDIIIDDDRASDETATLGDDQVQGNVTGEPPSAKLRERARQAPPPPTAPTEPPKARAAESPQEHGEGKTETLRIDARKVSLIMDLTGEIALACGAVTHHPELEGSALEGFSAASHKLEVLIRELQSEVSAMRLVPVAAAFQRMKRVVRDTAKRTGKKVDLVLIGEDTEIDKVMVDALHDPLVHLVRNAIDHGIESPKERALAGKPETGRLVLEASHQGGEW